jgi:hypothetical protein
MDVTVGDQHFAFGFRTEEQRHDEAHQSADCADQHRQCEAQMVFDREIGHSDNGGNDRPPTLADACQVAPEDAGNERQSAGERRMRALRESVK